MNPVKLFDRIVSAFGMIFGFGDDIFNVACANGLSAEQEFALFDDSSVLTAEEQTEDALRHAEQAATDSFVGFGFRGKNQLDFFLIGCIIPFMQ